MPTKELNDAFIRTAKPPVPGTRIEYYDTLVQGLTLIVSDRKRVFYFIYSRPGDGKRQRIKLGRYPDLALSNGDNPRTPPGARQKAKEARDKVSSLVDPVAEKRAQLLALSRMQTVADLVNNYLARKVAGNRSAMNTARQLRKNISGLLADGTPYKNASPGCIGDVRLCDLTRADITKALDAIVARGSIIAANRVFAAVRPMVVWAVGRGELAMNLCEGMPAPGDENGARDRWLDDDQIRTVWARLAGANDMRVGTRHVLQLMLMTACRVSEVTGMTTDELDLDTRVWTIPPERTKNGREHKVPLTERAYNTIMAQLAHVDFNNERHQRTTAHKFVFPAPGARKAQTGMSITKALYRQTEEIDGVELTLGVERFSTHALRHTVVTHMGRLKVNRFIRSCVVNHASVTKATITDVVYDHEDYLDEKRAALELWGQHLDRLIDGTDVVSLREAA